MPSPSCQPRNSLSGTFKGYDADRLTLWFHRDGPATAPASTADNIIVLSQAFCDEIDQHRVPVERDVVALLRTLLVCLRP